MKNYVIGVDFGTDSVRTVVLDAEDGSEVTSAVVYYPRWKKGMYCNAAAQMFRQHPLDFIEALEESVVRCVEKAGTQIASNIKALSVDTTGSTPVAVNEHGTPLAMLEPFKDNPNAMFVLWKDHTAIREAAEINDYNKRSPEDYLKFVGGVYSSEWFWAKLLHVMRVDAQVREVAYTWVEHCDWIPFLLTGGGNANDIKRSVCAAGHKGLWAEEFNGFPPDDFFTAIDPMLKGVVMKLPTRTYAANEAAGTLSEEWSRRLKLPSHVVIGIGAFDAHMGAVGSQIEPYYLSKVMGTSTCDMLVAPIEDIRDIRVKGICGQVRSSIIPGMVGLEAGQSAFGDVYAWLRKFLLWPLQHLAQNSNQTMLEEIEQEILPALSVAADKIDINESSELAIDWLNGRRTPDANQELKGAVVGLHLASDPPAVFRALAESTCFGARRIVDRFIEEGVPIKGLIGIGGVAKKSPFIMQMMSDVMNMPIRIHRSEQSCAAGAAMFAATVAGLYPDVKAAMAKMGAGFEATYYPTLSRSKIYNDRYEQYKKLSSFIETIR